jgi:hypothetical protein
VWERGLEGVRVPAKPAPLPSPAPRGSRRAIHSPLLDEDGVEGRRLLISPGPGEAIEVMVQIGGGLLYGSLFQQADDRLAEAQAGHLRAPLDDLLELRGNVAQSNCGHLGDSFPSFLYMRSSRSVLSIGSWPPAFWFPLSRVGGSACGRGARG